MKTMILDAPEFGFIVGTRALLAVGVGLLLASRFTTERRREIGTVMVAIGALTTIPAALSVFRGFRRSRRQSLPRGVAYDAGLIGVERFPRKGDDTVE
jgi:hypothetical protein